MKQPALLRYRKAIALEDLKSVRQPKPAVFTGKQFPDTALIIGDPGNVITALYGITD